MYSPVFLSWPTTSGSPPVLSISLSDHSFSAVASSFACTLAHSRPLWRFMFFSKRAFIALKWLVHWFAIPLDSLTFEPLSAASWALERRTALRTPRSAVASPRDSSPDHQRCGRWEIRSEADPEHRRQCASRRLPRR